MPEIPETQLGRDGANATLNTVAAGAGLTLSRFARRGTVLIIESTDAGAGTVSLALRNGRTREVDVPAGDTVALYLMESASYPQPAEVEADFAGTVTAVHLGDPGVR